MSLKQYLLTELKEYNVYRLDIDKSADLKGRPANRIDVFMRNPKGFNTGALLAQFHLTKDTAMSDEQVVAVIKSYINGDIEQHIIEVEE